VPAQPEKIRQVILNLMLNAIESMPAGGPIRLSLAPSPGDRVRFSVADSGKGVEPPVGQDIFAPFVSTKEGGAGLGLHICRQIIVQHGGQIGYDSTPQGATFWFELPAAVGSA
jgi:signal transduction histidine kinase